MGRGSADDCELAVSLPAAVRWRIRTVRGALPRFCSLLFVLNTDSRSPSTNVSHLFDGRIGSTTAWRQVGLER